MSNQKWIVTLSDGSVLHEGEGEYTIIPGERKPFVRLVEKLKQEGKSIHSLSVDVDGKVTHLPGFGPGPFATKKPSYFSLCYRYEADQILGNMKEKHLVDIGAHYDTFAVHYIHDITNGLESWVTITDNEAPLKSPVILTT